MVKLIRSLFKSKEISNIDAELATIAMSQRS